MTAVGGLSATLRAWRRRLKRALPYVRRREHARLMQRHELVTEALGVGTPRAADAALAVLRPVVPGTVDALCLFVSFQPGPDLKPHVVAHIDSLLARGIQVVLVLNATVPATDVRVDPAWAARLHGLFVRENLGYDFAAWAHVHALVSPQLTARRLYLINDSIVGPLDDAAFGQAVARVNASPADVVGLTEALAPRPHLQSFFLAFNARAVAEGLTPFFREVLCFAEKESVVDVYETWLTTRLRRAGLTCEALFPPLLDHDDGSTDVYQRWDALIAVGFPYVKTTVLARHANHPTLRRLVAGRLPGN